MNKNEILKVVEYKGDNKEIKQSVTRIRDLLTAIPEDADLGAIPGIDDFRDNGAFGSYNNKDSRINSEEEKNRILSNLDSIFHETTKWIKDHSLEVKYNILTSGRKNDKKRRIIFIVILALIAAIAITLTILQRAAHLISGNVQIGEIIGLVDLVLGIVGFIYELMDDGKKEAHCSSVDDIANCQPKLSLLTIGDDSPNISVGQMGSGTVIGNNNTYTYNIIVPDNIIVSDDKVVNECQMHKILEMAFKYFNTNCTVTTAEEVVKTGSSDGVILCKLPTWRYDTKTIYIDEIAEQYSENQCKIACTLVIDNEAKKIYMHSNNYSYSLKAYFPNLRVISLQKPIGKQSSYVLGANSFINFADVKIEGAQYVSRLERGCFRGVCEGRSVNYKRQYLKEKGFNSNIYGLSDDEIKRIFE